MRKKKVATSEALFALLLSTSVSIFGLHTTLTIPIAANQNVNDVLPTAIIIPDYSTADNIVNTINCTKDETLTLKNGDKIFENMKTAMPQINLENDLDVPNPVQQLKTKLASLDSIDKEKEDQEAITVTNTARFARHIDRFNDAEESKNHLQLETKNIKKDGKTENSQKIRNYYDEIRPTKTQFISNEISSVEKSIGAFPGMEKSSGDFPISGEAERASSRGRSLLLTEPDIARSNLSATQPTNDSAGRSSSMADRKTGNNGDIQEIINGFVKLLNGNVAVQVNTNGPPVKSTFPSRSRINNRGPPRISDVPPSIFDSPIPAPADTTTQTLATQTTQVSFVPIKKQPHPSHPYPFDIPQSVPLPPQPTNAIRPYVVGIPLPELLVPSEVPSNISAPSASNSSVFSNVSGNPNLSTEDKLTKDEKNSILPKTPPKNAIILMKPETPFEIEPTSVIPIDKSSRTKNETNTVSNSTDNNTVVNVVQKANESLTSNSTTPDQHLHRVVDRKKPNTTENTKDSNNSGFPASTSKSPAGLINSSVDLQPTTGIGVAVVLLEASTPEIPTHQDAHKVTAATPALSSTVKRKPPSSGHHNEVANGYFPRPGIVLDDADYKPGSRRPTVGPSPGIITAAPIKPAGAGYHHNKDIFDITVSAIQGPGSTAVDTNSSKIGQPYIYPVDIDTGAPLNNGNNELPVITTAQNGQNFVSIDGKRTYLNLFDSTSTHAIGSVQPTHVKNHGAFGAHTATHGPPLSSSQHPTTKTSGVNNGKPSSPAWRKPTHPPVRIDTCIVGDDSTCDITQHEMCRTEVGVSSCHCRPGYNRRKHREPCHRVISLFLTLRVDRMYDQHLLWSEKYSENESSEYQQLEYEATKAIDSALSMTPFSDLFMGARVNNIYTSKNSNTSPPVFVNLTIQLSESPETLRAPVKQDLQKHLMGVIHRRSNNIGSSPLWVDSPTGAVSQIHDVDECTSSDLNDCHSSAKCTNVFGSFYCTCPEGYRDPWNGNNHRSGRMCETCDTSKCNYRGECSFQNGQPICKCVGSYYGSQCEIDGEVLGVAIGSSMIAILIIVTTLACLCAWSRRWNKEQKIGSPIFGYMPTGGSTVKTPVMGAPPYQVSLEDRVRWAQIADAMAHANHYGPEPVGTLRPSSIFGYTLPHSNGPLIMPRLRPPSVHTLRTPESSTSEEEDRADLLGRHFHVPRPKSRSSVANQSGIYYDVDYESQQQNGEIFSTMKSGQPCIPLNTYTMGSRSHYYR